MELRITPDADSATATISLSGTLSAEQIRHAAYELFKAAAELSPVPAEFDPNTPSAPATERWGWFTSATGNGHSLIVLRHSALGWVPTVIPSSEAVRLAAFLNLQAMQHLMLSVQKLQSPPASSAPPDVPPPTSGSGRSLH